MSLVIVDYTLRTLMGHSFAYDSATVCAAREAGWERILVLGHKTVLPEIQQSLGARPSFAADLDEDLTGPWGGLLERNARLRKNMRLHRRQLLRDLVALGDDIFDADARNLVFVPNLRYLQLIPIVQWLERVHRKVRVECSIVLRFTAFPDFDTASCTADFYRLAFCYLEASPVRDRVHLFADSEELVNEYRDYTRIPVTVIPIPHTPPEPLPDAAASDGRPDVPRLVYLGDARRSKGYPLLAELFSSLRRELEEGAISAELQSNVRNHWEGEVVRAKRVLQRLPSVVLHETVLSPEQYDALLRRADLVLAPYTLESYHSQTSGIVVEAIAAGKPLLVPRGTWGARQVRCYGNCGVTFLPGDPESLRQAVLEALASLPALRQRAIAASEACRRYHNRQTFFAAIADHEFAR